MYSWLSNYRLNYKKTLSLRRQLETKSNSFATTQSGKKGKPMDQDIKKERVAAENGSYQNRVGGFLIPADQLGQIVRIPVGFQPLGLASRFSLLPGITQVLVCSYFHPAICRLMVGSGDAGLDITVSWIRNTDHGLDSLRLFPGSPSFLDISRAQTVVCGYDDKLWVSRNGDAEFFVLSQGEKFGRYDVTNRLVLPNNGVPMSLHSAVRVEMSNSLYTVESSQAANNKWNLYHYTIADDRAAFVRRYHIANLPPLMYGLDQRQGDNSGLWLVTDERCGQPPGIYRLELQTGELKLVVPEVRGNGLTFLPDGAAFVGYYGESSPNAFGAPGELIYVPAAAFTV